MNYTALYFMNIFSCGMLYMEYTFKPGKESGFWSTVWFFAIQLNAYMLVVEVLKMVGR